MNWALVMLLALGIDALIGWPDALYRRIGHPVTWLGAMIRRMEAALNHEDEPPARRRWAGAVTTAAAVGLAAGLAGLITLALPAGPLGTALAAILAWPLIAARSLHEHVARVARPLSTGDTEAARHSLAMIVGRDPSRLDASGIARAALESLGENASDGVIAPLFWGALLGLPGIAAYKAINTLDSMIGYRTERYVDFGRFAARLDDAANLLPARLTGILIAAVSGRAKKALRIMWRDASRHRSPNAGWPEAALAGAVGVRLSGPRVYDTGPTDDAWLNGTAPDAAALDLERGLGVFLRMTGAAALGLGVIAALV